MTTTVVGAVVVHWRGMNDTLECLASLGNSDCAGLRVYVVVNGPGDFDEAAARRALPDVALIQAPTNEGYAAACNRGLAAFADADTVVFLNNDVVVAPDAIALLAKALAERPAAGLAGPVVAYYDDPTRIWSAGGSVHPWLGYTRHHAFNARSAPSELRAVDFINGCTIAIRRDLAARLGGLDASYFHYFEDTDISARARSLGYDCLVVPAARVQHKISASAGERGSNRMNATQAYYFARNRALFVRRNFTGARRITATIAQPFLVLYEIAKDARDRNASAARARPLGLIAGLRGRTGPKDARP